MPKNKKSYLVKPQGSTVTSKKQNPKVERIANIVKGAAIAAIPVGRAATTVSRIASAVTKPRLASAGRTVKTKTVTQGPKARVTAKAPGKEGAAYSPVKGTKVKVEYETKKLSAQQERNVDVLRRSQKARRGLAKAQGAAGVYVATKETKSKKASQNKKK